MKNRKQIFNGALAIFLLCTISSCMPARYLFNPPSDGSGRFSSRKESHEDERYAEWCYDFPDYIIPRICAYYRVHPERFKPTGRGEEIQVDGFFEFVKNDDYFKGGHRSSVWTGKILDPWGDPVHFVQDLDMDGYVEDGWGREIVFDGNKRASKGQLSFGIAKYRYYKDQTGQPLKTTFARLCH